MTTLLSTHDAAQQRGADAWLSSFSSTAGAWETCLQLLLWRQPEVAYFAANLLLTKVRREWSSTEAALRAGVAGGCSAALVAAAREAPSAAPSLVARRLCLVLAAAGARSQPLEAAQFVRQALELGAQPGGAPLALSLLRALAEEADEAPRGRRTALVGAVCTACPPVLALAEGAAEGGAPTEALRCSLAWLRLDPAASVLPGGPSAGGRLLLSPGALASTAPRLHACALRSLAAQQDELLEAAADFLAELHSVVNPREDPGSEARHVEATVGALVALQHAAEAPDGEATARCVRHARDSSMPQTVFLTARMRDVQRHRSRGHLSC